MIFCPLCGFDGIPPAARWKGALLSLSVDLVASQLPLQPQLGNVVSILAQAQVGQIFTDSSSTSRNIAQKGVTGEGTLVDSFHPSLLDVFASQCWKAKVAPKAKAAARGEAQAGCLLRALMDSKKLHCQTPNLRAKSCSCFGPCSWGLPGNLLGMLSRVHNHNVVSAIQWRASML